MREKPSLPSLPAASEQEQTQSRDLQPQQGCDSVFPSLMCQGEGRGPPCQDLTPSQVMGSTSLFPAGYGTSAAVVTQPWSHPRSPGAASPGVWVQPEHGADQVWCQNWLGAASCRAPEQQPHLPQIHTAILARVKAGGPHPPPDLTWRGLVNPRTPAPPL